MTWIRVEDGLSSHPKTFDLADAMVPIIDALRPEQLSLICALGSLLHLWLETSRHRPGGELTGFSSRAIERMAGLTGADGDLFEALKSSGFVDEKGGGIEVHDWLEYAYRRRDANRKKKNRNDYVPRPPKCADIGGHRTDIDGHATENPEYGRTDGRTDDTDGRTDGHTTGLPGLEPISPEELVQLWREVCVSVGLSDIRKISKDRGKAIAKALKEQGASREWWRSYFERITKTPFLLGQTGGTWRVDFDTALKDRIATGTLEGKYDDKKQQNQAEPNYGEEVS